MEVTDEKLLARVQETVCDLRCMVKELHDLRGRVKNEAKKVRSSLEGALLAFNRSSAKCVCCGYRVWDDLDDYGVCSQCRDYGVVG